MKFLILVNTAIIFLAFSQLLFSQELRTVEFNEDMSNFVSPFEAVLNPSDTLQFKTTNGAFTIFIDDAYEFLIIDTADLEVTIDGEDNPFSDKYIVKSNFGKERKVEYIFYCISKDEWPEAPPRIVLSRKE